MQINRRNFPENQELVIGVVNRILKHGVYITLKEYQSMEGYCHISEVAGAWIRNIRNFVRIDQTVVAKVLRVNRETRQVDLSLKRVSDAAKKEKNQEFKKQVAALAMLKLIAEKVDSTAEKIREQIEDKLIEAYGTMHVGFEELAALGPEAVNDLGFPDSLVKVMHEVAETSIQINKTSLTSTLGIRSFASDGVEQIKSLLKTAEEEVSKFPEITAEITSIGAPAYRIFIEGFSYEEVDYVFQSVSKAISEKSKSLDVEYKLEKEEKPRS